MLPEIQGCVHDGSKRLVHAGICAVSADRRCGRAGPAANASAPAPAAAFGPASRVTPPPRRRPAPRSWQAASSRSTPGGRFAVLSSALRGRSCAKANPYPPTRKDAGSCGNCLLDGSRSTSPRAAMFPSHTGSDGRSRPASPSTSLTAPPSTNSMWRFPRGCSDRPCRRRVRRGGRRRRRDGAAAPLYERSAPVRPIGERYD